jgi:RNA ligase (TIGR02306 family)
MKLRGVISQGLLMSTGLFEELNGRELYEGMDLTEELNVVKWDPPEIAQGNIVGKPGKPYGIPTTDETRLQSAPEQVEEFVGKPYYITVKCDGTSCSMYKYNDSYGVTTRSMGLTIPSDASADNAYTKMYRKLELYKKLDSNIVIQGELCGPSIQKNRMRLGEYHWYVFDAYDLDSHTYYGYRELKALCDVLELEMVPLLEEGDSYPKEYNLEELLSKAVCKYPNGSQAEGIVVRLQDVRPERRSFKVINNQYLLKEKE